MRHMVQTCLHYSYLTGRSNSTPAAIISRNLRISFLCISSNLDDLSSWQQILSLKYQTWVAENSLPYFVLHTLYVEYKLSREFWWFQNYSFFQRNLKKMHQGTCSSSYAQGQTSPVDKSLFYCVNALSHMARFLFISCLSLWMKFIKVLI